MKCANCNELQMTNEIYACNAVHCAAEVVLRDMIYANLIKQFFWFVCFWISLSDIPFDEA